MIEQKFKNALKIGKQIWFIFLLSLLLLLMAWLLPRPVEVAPARLPEAAVVIPDLPVVQ
jgi:hypothetical protein